MLPYSHSRPVTPQVNIINTQLNVALTAVLSGKQTATQALKTANDLRDYGDPTESGVTGDRAV